MQVYAQLPTVQPHDCMHTATCISLMCSHTTKQEHCEDTHSQLTSIQYPGTAEHHAIKPTLVFAPLDHQTVLRTLSSIVHGRCVNSKTAPNGPQVMDSKMAPNEAEVTSGDEATLLYHCLIQLCSQQPSGL